jgi:hypothetical protein
MPKLIITIVNAGTPEIDPKTRLPIPSSTAGHMWYTIRNDDGTEVHNYGFAPDGEHQGQPVAPGYSYKDDQIRYQIDLESGDRQYTADINQEQFNKLHDFGENPARHDFKLDKYQVLSLRLLFRAI